MPFFTFPNEIAGSNGHTPQRYLPVVCDVLDPVAIHLTWYLLDFEGIGDVSWLGYENPKLEEDVRASEVGVRIEWTGIKHLARSIQTLEWLDCRGIETDAVERVGVNWELLDYSVIKIVRFDSSKVWELTVSDEVAELIRQSSLSVIETEPPSCEGYH